MFYILLVCIIMCGKQRLQIKKRSNFLPSDRSSVQFSLDFAVNESRRFQTNTQFQIEYENSVEIIVVVVVFDSSIKSKFKSFDLWTGKIVVATQRVPFISVYSWHIRDGVVFSWMRMIVYCTDLVMLAASASMTTHTVTV